MTYKARPPEEIVENLLYFAIQNDDCQECHLAGFSDRANRTRHFIMVGGRGGKRWRASRLVWHILFGPIPDGLWVLHECDNPACINPWHLFLGTPQDNTDDMIAKGRKVDDSEVWIRRRLRTAKAIQRFKEQGLHRYDIAYRTGLSPSTVWNYLNGPYKDTLTVLAGHEHNGSVGFDVSGNVEDVS